MCVCACVYFTLGGSFNIDKPLYPRMEKVVERSILSLLVNKYHKPAFITSHNVAQIYTP